jgi:hypothetical protein
MTKGDMIGVFPVDSLKRGLISLQTTYFEVPSAGRHLYAPSTHVSI